MADITLADHVRVNPCLSQVFEALGLDFCCHGRTPLGEALKEKGLENALSDILAKMEKCKAENAARVAAGEATETRYDLLSSKDLVRHIIDTHHAYLRREIPPLQQLMEKVARVHGQTHPELIPLRDTIIKTTSALLVHLDEEEEGIFKTLTEVEEKDLTMEQIDAMLAQIDRLEADHKRDGGALDNAEELTNKYTVPGDACNSYRALYSRLQALESDIHHHVHKENYILFPRIAALKKQRLEQN